MTPAATVRRPKALTCLRAPVAFLRHPFLAPGPRRTPIIHRGWEKGRHFFLHVGAEAPDISLATQADGDVLTYAVTQLTDRLNSGIALERPLTVRSGELLRGLGRDTGGRQHALLAAQIERLNATMVSTDLRGTHQCFNLIERSERVGARAGVWKLYLPAFLIEEVRARRVLQINSAAVHLRGLERCIYGWARAHVGLNGIAHWDLSLDRAHASAGSEDLKRRFCSAMRAIVERNRLPDYALQWVAQDKSAGIRMTRRDASAATAVATRDDTGGGAPGPENDVRCLELSWPDAGNPDRPAPIEKLCWSELIGPSDPIPRP